MRFTIIKYFFRSSTFYKCFKNKFYSSTFIFDKSITNEEIMNAIKKSAGKYLTNIYLFDNNYYINIDEISYQKFLTLIEFSSFIYGDELLDIKNKLLLVNK